MTVRVEVNKDILMWALSRSGLTKDTLLIEYPEKFSKIYEWFDGSIQPTVNQLEEFASITSTPFGFLFLDKPPVDVIDVPFYRTKNETNSHQISPNLKTTIRTMQKRQQWLREFLINSDYKTLEFVKSIRIDQDVKESSSKIRIALGLEKKWASQFKTWNDALKYIKEAIEDIGIVIITNSIVGNNTHRKLSVEEFRGFVLVDDYAPFIFVNGADSKSAQMFTIIHELAHIFLGSSAIFDLRELQPSTDEIEIICNKIAAEFLVPEDYFRLQLTNISVNKETIEHFSKHFKVSELVIARRLLDIGKISKKYYFEFYNEYLKFEKRGKQKAGGGDYYENQNQRVGKYFALQIDKAIQEDKLMYYEAYRLIDMHGRTYDQFIKSVKDAS